MPARRTVSICSAQEVICSVLMIVVIAFLISGQMVTRSGRFAVEKKICMSMSDFHPELWNPTW